MNGSIASGTASSGKIASTGHSGSHAPQSMHSSGSITSMRSDSWMQSTGQTSTHERSFTSMQGSVMMYVTSQGLLGFYRRCNCTQRAVQLAIDRVGDRSPRSAASSGRAPGAITRAPAATVRA